MQYVSSATGDDESCIFCAALEQAEGELASHVLHRGDNAFVILNAYPYNTGHLMIAPNRHVGELDDLDAGERASLMDLTSEATTIIREAMSPHGFNIGMNLGRVAGAGIPGHLHVHVVPRWGGDTNFMPVVGNTKVLPEMIADTDAKLRPLFARLNA
jgi:ATP adenylyltransferase